MKKKPKKNNIIPFPEERIQKNLPAEDDLSADLSASDEWLDIEDELWAKEDFEKLILLHQEQLEKYPKDHFARFSLAQAYFFNYEYEKALETLNEIHKKIPEDQDVCILFLKCWWLPAKVKMILTGRSNRQSSISAKKHWIYATVF